MAQFSGVALPKIGPSSVPQSRFTKEIATGITRLLPGFYWVIWADEPEPPEVAQYRHDGWVRMGVNDVSHTPPSTIVSGALMPPILWQDS